ncbi:hypothetical protein NKH57_17925 [Mesorhizobium sp. M1050]|uniref:hypothetical protein n=1 Tax=unclassified Mesorhizobium TaxID=325217 RepID=UPI00333500E5
MLQPIAAFVISHMATTGGAARFAIVVAIVLPTVTRCPGVTYDLNEVPGQKAGCFVGQRFGRKTWPAPERTPAE